MPIALHPARLPAALPAMPPAQAPRRLPSAGFPGVDFPIPRTARISLLTRRGGLWFHTPRIDDAKCPPCPLNCFFGDFRGQLASRSCWTERHAFAMRGSSSHRGRESPAVPGALRDLPGRMAFAMRGTAPDSLRLRSGCSWPKRLRFDVEINTPEHFVVLDFAKQPFSVVSRGHAESPDIATFELDELLATKVETIYRRRNGRDLFDLAIGRAHGWSGAGQIVDALWRTLTAKVVW